MTFGEIDRKQICRIRHDAGKSCRGCVYADSTRCMSYEHKKWLLDLKQSAINLNSKGVEKHEKI